MKVSYVKTLPPALRKRYGNWKAILMRILEKGAPALIEFQSPEAKKKAEKSIRGVVSQQYRDTFQVTSHSPLAFSIAKKEPQS